jgi:uncharacterized protein
MKVGQLDVDMDAIRAFCEKHHLAELSLFGSALRDDFNDASDVDFLFEPCFPESMSIELLMAMQEELEAMFERRVDLVRKSLVQNPFRRHHILATRRKIYERPAA